jgi:AraC family transcriptional regulator
MKTHEPFILPDSNYYVYSPSLSGRGMFFYPLTCGHFFYAPEYHLHRASFDSFLLLYVKSGSMYIQTQNDTFHAHEDDFVLLDCYQPHSYGTNTGSECIWCHFDGPLARNFYDTILSHLGTVFSIGNSAPTVSKLTLILESFQRSAIKEALLSKYINDILTGFLLYSPADNNNDRTDTIESVISYINEHFKEDLSDANLADLVGLSHYHFIRVFKRETGFTPHEYVINTRLGNARYLLRNTQMSVKDICFSCGFSSESSFCITFKKRAGMTPAMYRLNGSEVT